MWTSLCASLNLPGMSDGGMDDGVDGGVEARLDPVDPGLDPGLDPGPLDRELPPCLRPVARASPVLRCPACGRPLVQSAASTHAASCPHRRDPRLPRMGSHGVQSRHTPVVQSSGVAFLPATPTPPAPLSLPQSQPQSQSQSQLQPQPQPLPQALDADPAAAKDKKPKKRKPAADSDRPSSRPKKSKVKEFDPDQMCGVFDVEKTGPCLRAITCKVHPVSAKRQVRGRTMDFDRLVEIYANRVQRNRQQISQPTTTAAALIPIQAVMFPNVENSDQEADLILKIIRNNSPTPLAPPPFIDLTFKNKALKLRNAMIEILKAQRSSLFLQLSGQSPEESS